MTTKIFILVVLASVFNDLHAQCIGATLSPYRYNPKEEASLFEVMAPNIFIYNHDEPLEKCFVIALRRLCGQLPTIESESFMIFSSRKGADTWGHALDNEEIYLISMAGNIGSYSKGTLTIFNPTPKNIEMPKNICDPQTKKRNTSFLSKIKRLVEMVIKAITAQFQ